MKVTSIRLLKFNGRVELGVDNCDQRTGATSANFSVPSVSLTGKTPAGSMLKKSGCCCKVDFFACPRYSAQEIAIVSIASHNENNTPSILGIWRLGEPIHSGRSAELYFAQPADAEGSPRWDYVLKRATGTDGNAENLRQIVQFASASADVSHPNLVPVLDASSTGASPYLVMPALEGATMQAHLDQDVKPLPVALWLVRQVAQALVAIHSAGWVHGDVKPENTIVGSRGHVTLIDLGFATRVHTVSGSKFRGTPEYAAPEVVHGDMAALPSADIFSLGRTLWKWLTRIEPTNDVVLEPVAELVEQMLAENPNDRPAADEITRKLLRMEIDTLGHHIGPSDRPDVGHARAA